MEKRIEWQAQQGQLFWSKLEVSISNPPTEKECQFFFKIYFLVFIFFDNRQCKGPTTTTTKTKTTITATTASPCAVPSKKGDGFCDGINNNAACDWDGEDCRRKYIRPRKDYPRKYEKKNISKVE